MIGIFGELKRRRVYQAAAIYAVVAWGLAQVVDFIAERLFLPEWIPTLTAIIFVVGFPVAIFLSWIFDIGPGGIRRTGPGSVRGILSLSIATVMLIGGSALIYSIVWPRHESAQVATAAAPPNSIAVLPFSILGDTDGSEFLSDGIAEEILYALSSLKDLRVAARTSSFSFKDKGLAIADISRALNVQNVLEGSIRMAGDRLSVRVRLIRADTGFALWSDSYDSLADDVFEVQQDIAGNIADAIRAEMGIAAEGDRPRFRVQTTDTEAYRLYLQGRFLWHQRGPENIRSAVAFFDQAIQQDPEFAAAWAGLASAYMTSGTYGAGIANHFQKSGEAALKAIELDNQLGEPYGPLAQIEINAENYAKGERYIEQGLNLTPKNSSLRLWYATYLIQFGRGHDAMQQVALVIDNDPAYPILRANFGFSNFISGNLDIAKENLDRAWQLGLRPYFMWLAIQQLNINLKDFAAADSWLEQMPDAQDPESNPYVDLQRAWIAAMREPSANNNNTVSEMLERLISGKQIGHRTSAYMFTSIGKADRAMKIYMLRAAAGQYVDKGTLWLPAMKPFRMHDQFSELAGLLQLTDYWQQIAWPDNCGPADDGGVRCFR